MDYRDTPKIDEYLWATKDNTPVYYDPKVSAERVLSNYANDQSFHEFRKGDQIGQLVDDGIIRDADGNEFFKIKTWQWKRKGLSFLSSFEPYQEYFEAYVQVKHEPDYWIRESRKDSFGEAVDKTLTDSDVSGYISGLRGVPQPVEITKDANGVIQLTFANGYKVSFDAFKRLSADAVRTATTQDLSKKVNTSLKSDTASGTQKESTTGINTNTMIIAGAAALLFVLVTVLILKQK
jgi:hypothetical protein